MKRDADRTAAKWEEALRNGVSSDKQSTTWKEFRERIDTDYVPALAKKSGERLWSVLDSFERIVQPNLLSVVTTSTITKWQTRIRNNGLSEAAIKSNRATLKAALRWTASNGMIREAPAVNMPKRAKSSDRQTPMKGRALTDDEFQRMLNCVECVVGPEAEESWTDLFHGLWLSGLRLAEALSFTCDRDNELRVDESGRHTMLAIPAERQKSHRDELLPIAPEFRDFLRDVPETERSGYVFPLVWQPGGRNGQGRRVDTVSKKISAIGEAAEIMVSVKNGRTKYASVTTYHGRSGISGRPECRR